MTGGFDDERLDDQAAVRAADAQDMLRAVATGAAQVRMGRTAAADAGIDVLRDEARPRAVVAAGMGGSGIAGEVLAALTVATAPVPVVVHRGGDLPAWVGAADLVLAVSCSGSTAETLAAAEEAARRGARLVGVGAAESPLADLCRQARGIIVPVTAQLAPRASMWALTTPLLVAAARLGLLDLGADDEQLELAAERLEQVAEACRPDRELFVNPAKELAAELAGSLPMIWGAGPAGAMAAYRFGCQLAENAKAPALTGALPEAHHNQVMTLDGALAGAAAEADLFRDRTEDGEPLRLRLVLVHDDDGNEETATRVAVSRELADSRGVATSLVASAGSAPLERLASVVGVTDYASVYLALGAGIDPTPIAAIDMVKDRLRVRS